MMYHCLTDIHDGDRSVRGIPGRPGLRRSPGGHDGHQLLRLHAQTEVRTYAEMQCQG